MASRTIIGCCCVFLLSLPVLTARGRDADPLVLAENGTTRYAIIIATAAYFWAGAHFILAGKTLVADLKRASDEAVA